MNSRSSRQVAQNPFAGAGVPPTLRVVQQPRLGQAVGLQQLAARLQVRQRFAVDAAAVADLPAHRQTGFNLPLGEASEFVRRGPIGENLLLQPQQPLVTSDLLCVLRHRLQGVLVRGDPPVLVEGICRRIEDGLGPLPQGRCGARRVGGRKIRKPVPGATEGLQPVGINPLGEPAVGLAAIAPEASVRSRCRPRATSSRPGCSSGLSCSMAMRVSARASPAASPNDCPCNTVASNSASACAAARAFRGSCHTAASEWKRGPRGCPRAASSCVPEGFAAPGGNHDVVRLGDRVLQFGGLRLRPRQLVTVAGRRRLRRVAASTRWSGRCREPIPPRTCGSGAGPRPFCGLPSRYRRSPMPGCRPRNADPLQRRTSRYGAISSWAPRRETLSASICS